MTIGEKIKQIRISKGLTQLELAKMVGFDSAAAISKIEKGTRDINQSKVKLFADALGVTPSYLLGDIEEAQDELFEKRKLLFDLSKKATPEELDKFITILNTIIGD